MLIKNNSTNFKAINLNNKEMQDANRLFKMTRVVKDKDIGEIYQDIYNLFDKHIQKEANYKAGFNGVYAAFNAYYAKFLNLISQIKLNNTNPINFINEINDFHPSKYNKKEILETTVFNELEKLTKIKELKKSLKIKDIEFNKKILESPIIIKFNNKLLNKKITKISKEFELSKEKIINIISENPEFI